MRRKTKLWLCIAGAMVIVGTALSGIGFTMVGGNLAMLSTNKYQTKEYIVSENFQNIAFSCCTAKIDLVAADYCKVVCYEEGNAPHTVKVEGDTLEIKVLNKKKWYQYIGINFDTPKIIVYLPQGTYGNLSVSCTTGDTNIPSGYDFNKIDITGKTGQVVCCASAEKDLRVKLTTGSIRLAQVTAGQLALSVSTGDIIISDAQCKGDAVVNASTGNTKLTDLTCTNLTSSGTTGDLDMKKVVVSETFSASRTTGDVGLNMCDAAEITITTGTGQVEGTLLSDKVFIANTTTGRVDIPKTTTGGKCKIRTTTGNINLSISK